MLEFSWSDAETFMRCRRKWELTSFLRSGLAPKRTPRAFSVGKLVHKGLEAQLLCQDPLSAIRKEAGQGLLEFEQRYQETVGCLPDHDELVPFHEDRIFATQLTLHYISRHPDPWPGYRVLAAERSFAVPLPGCDATYTGTVDALLLDTYGKVWVVDHKTFSRQPQDDDLALHPQFRAYTWAMAALFGPSRVGGFIYDGIRKQIPKAPDINKNGSVSKRLTKAHTLYLYEETLRRHKQEPRDYAEQLRTLRERLPEEEEYFFPRRTVPLERGWLRQVERNLVSIAQEMDNPRIYPNFRWEGCSDCGVRAICHSMERGYDPSAVIETQFQPRQPYVTRENLTLTPIEVSRPEDLLRDDPSLAGSNE